MVKIVIHENFDEPLGDDFWSGEKMNIQLDTNAFLWLTNLTHRNLSYFCFI